MKYSLFKDNILKHLTEYKINYLGITTKGEWHKNPYGHILPIKSKHDYPMINNNFIFDINSAKNKVSELEHIEKHYHMFAHHLNSSQIMCINFFAPFLLDNDKKKILKKVLESCCVGLRIGNNSEIEKAIFEYTPNKREGTNFDFFLEFSKGEKIYFEIKYTEAEFGSIKIDKLKPNRYIDKWENIYKSIAKGYTQDEFYAKGYYQINRNIIAQETNKDYTVFIYPFDNENLDNLAKDLNYFNKPFMRFYNKPFNIDWYDLVKNAKEINNDPVLENLLDMFENKYLPRIN